MKKINYADLFTLRADGRYQGYWRDDLGVRHTIYDRDPEKLYHKIEEKKAKKPDTTLRDIAEAWETEYRQTVSDRTWNNFRPHLEKILKEHGSRDITQITGETVLNDMIRAKGQGYSHTIVNSIRVIYSNIFTYAAGKGLILYNPALAVKVPKGCPKGVRRAPNDEEIRTIIQNRNEPDGLIPFALLCTGLRRSELIKRAKSDIDTKAWTINVPKSKTEAGIRKVPIIEPLRDLLKSQLDAHPNSPWVFPSTVYNCWGGEDIVLSDSAYDTIWMNYCKRVGWIDQYGKPTLTAHNLRHGTATLLYETGVDVYTAKDILGHAHIETTMAIYTELRNKHRNKNIDKFSAGLTERILFDVSSDVKSQQTQIYQ